MSKIEFYSRNYLFIEDEIQNILFKKKILYIGAGLGSRFIEDSVRLGAGLALTTIADGDVVDVSNLNRQNFTYEDIGEKKVKAIEKRIKEINPWVNLRVVSKYFDERRLYKYIPEHDIIVNTVDFDNGIFSVANTVAQIHGIPVLFPINLSRCGVLYVFKDCESLWSEFGNCPDSELKLKILKNTVDYLEKVSNRSRDYWRRDIFNNYIELNKAYDPQLVTGALLTSSLVNDAILRLCTGQKLKIFPEPMLLDISEV